MKRYILIGLLVVISFTFSACGGGGGGGTSVDPNAHKFIFEVKTDSFGFSADNQFIIPTKDAGYSYSVDCNNDGVFEATGVSGDYTCDYTSPGRYEIAIEGTFPQIYFNGGMNSDSEKVISLLQWGTGIWRSMNGAFFDCSNMIVNATDKPNLSQVTDMSYMFRGISSFSNDSITSWDVSNVEDMTELFSYNDFNLDISVWDVSSVTSFYGMFYSNVAFNQDISDWNTSSATDMTVMFTRASAFNQPIGSWDVSKVVQMESMFYQATSFDQDLGAWEVSIVENMTNMFIGVTLSTSNYDSLLFGWNEKGTMNGVIFHGGNSTYTDSSAAYNARKNLILNMGWTITDGGAI